MLVNSEIRMQYWCNLGLTHLYLEALIIEEDKYCKAKQNHSILNIRRRYSFSCGSIDNVIKARLLL